MVSLIMAFLVGGCLCLIGQLIMDLTKSNITSGHILIGYISGGAILSGLGLYQPLIALGGEGAAIPLTGFGHLLTQGALKGAEEGIIGAFSGGVEAAAAGITAAIIFGYIMAVLFDPRG